MAYRYRATKTIKGYKPIKKFPGYYVNSNGEIMSTLGKGNRDKSKTVAPYKLKPRPTKKGYLRVYMRDNDTHKRKDVYIHRIVAEAYLNGSRKRTNERNIVNHKNHDPSDNRVSNLEWVTQKENLEDNFKFGSVIRDKTNGKFKSGRV